METNPSVLAVVLTICQLTWETEVWEGESAALPCYGADNRTDVLWCKVIDGECKIVAKKFIRNTQPKMDPEKKDGFEISPNSSLIIRSVDHSHNGSYRCLSNDNRLLPLIVQEPVENVTVMAPVSRESATTVVSCKIQGGNPAPTINWYLGDSGTPVKTDLGRQGKMRTYTYQVQVTKEMNGQRLVCEASLRDQSLSDETTMTVTYKPAVMVEAFPSQYSSGDEVILLCNAQGNPKPDVTWMYEGMTDIADEVWDMTDGQRRLYKYNEYKASWSQDSSAVTVMYRIDKLTTNQTGKYTCFAWNQEGNDTADMTINVEETRTDAGVSWVILHVVPWCVVGVILVSLVVDIIAYRCRTTVFSRTTDPTYQTRIHPLTSVQFTNTERPHQPRTPPTEDDPSAYNSIDEITRSDYTTGFDVENRLGRLPVLIQRVSSQATNRQQYMSVHEKNRRYLTGRLNSQHA